MRRCRRCILNDERPHTYWLPVFMSSFVCHQVGDLIDGHFTNVEVLLVSKDRLEPPSGLLLGVGVDKVFLFVAVDQGLSELVRL